jgi:hypothetical protein
MLTLKEEESHINNLDCYLKKPEKGEQTPSMQKGGGGGGKEKRES